MSTYSTNLALELIATGDQSGTWGDTTNTNLGTLLEQAISGYVTQAITDGADTVITIPSGASGVARNMMIEMTGALTDTRNLIVPANKKLYFIYNNTTDGGGGPYAVTVKVSGQTGVSVPNGAKMLLACNGTDVVAILSAMPSLALSTPLGVASGGTGAATLSGLLLGNGTGAVTATAPTANSVLLGNGTSAPQTVAPGTSGNVLTSDGSTWASAAPNRVVATGYNFTGRTNATTPNSKVDFTASELVLKTSSATYLATSVSVTADITVSGANGLDTGSEAPSTWYYLWVIYNGTTVASLLSTSSSAPTMPGTYTYKALVGAVYNNGSSNFVAYRQKGMWLDYDSTQQVLTGGSASSETPFSTAAAVPAVATMVKFTVNAEIRAGVSGAAVTTVYFNVVPGGTTYRLALQAALGQTAYDTAQFQAMNNSQTAYYSFGSGGDVAILSADAYVSGFRMPGGGE